MAACRELLSTQPLFVVITAYAIRASALCLHFGLHDMMANYQGSIESGELVNQEKSAQRLISMAIYTRWSANS